MKADMLKRKIDNASISLDFGKEDPTPCQEHCLRLITYTKTQH